VLERDFETAHGTSASRVPDRDALPVLGRRLLVEPADLLRSDGQHLDTSDARRQANVSPS
jgi:hypothetical protein